MNITGKTTLYLNRNEYGVSTSICYKVQKKDVVKEKGKEVAKYVDDWAYVKVKLTQEMANKLLILDEVKEFAKENKNNARVKIDITKAFLSGFKTDNGIVMPYIMIQELEIVEEKKEETEKVTKTKGKKASLFDIK